MMAEDYAVLLCCVLQKIVFCLILLRILYCCILFLPLLCFNNMPKFELLPTASCAASYIAIVYDFICRAIST